MNFEDISPAFWRILPWHRDFQSIYNHFTFKGIPLENLRVPGRAPALRISVLNSQAIN